MTIFKFLLVPGALLWCLIPAFAEPVDSQPELLANPVYQSNCAKCHGKTAQGRHFGGPSLTDSKVAAASSDELLNIISNGKGHMPKYAGKLTPDEISVLVKQIKALSQK